MYFNIVKACILLLEIKQSSPHALSGDKDLKHHTLQPGDFAYWKGYLQKDSSTSLERPFAGTAHNRHATKPQGVGFWIHVTHLQKAPNAAWACTPSGDLEVKISQNWSRWHLMRQLFQDVQPRPVYLFLNVCTYLFCGKKMTLSAFPKLSGKGETSSFEYGLFGNSLIMILWAFPEELEGSEFTKRFFHLNFIWLWILIQMHGLWICNRTGCVIGWHLFPNHSFEITILL